MAIVHAIFSTIFVAFVVIDRVYIRCLTNRGSIYKKALFPMAIVSLIIVVSGVSLYHNHTLKATLGLATIVLFFACPIVSRKLGKTARFIYRAVVLLLALATAAIGIAL